MGYASDYFSLLRDGRLHTNERVLALFLGSNIGNYAPREANRLLRSLAGYLKSGDALLIGTDMKKDASVLELAYDDPTGVTAAFNKNIIARINRELGGEFDVRSFDHVAHYNEKRGAVESFLASRRKQKVQIRALGMEVEFERGETYSHGVLVQVRSRRPLADCAQDRLFGHADVGPIRWSATG